MPRQPSFATRSAPRSPLRDLRRGSAPGWPAWCSSAKSLAEVRSTAVRSAGAIFDAGWLSSLPLGKSATSLVHGINVAAANDANRSARCHRHMLNGCSPRGSASRCDQAAPAPPTRWRAKALLDRALTRHSPRSSDRVRRALARLATDRPHRASRRRGTVGPRGARTPSTASRAPPDASGSSATARPGTTQARTRRPPSAGVARRRRSSQRYARAKARSAMNRRSSPRRGERPMIANCSASRRTTRRRARGDQPRPRAVVDLRWRPSPPGAFRRSTSAVDRRDGVPTSRRSSAADVDPGACDSTAQGREVALLLAPTPRFVGSAADDARLGDQRRRHLGTKVSPFW